MASRMADSLALVRRCERAGWTSESSTRGIKIYNDGRLLYVIHKTYSDHRSLKNATAELERLGLKEAENRMTDLRFSTAKERTTKARKAAETKAEQIAAKNAAVQKAAGPYFTEAEDVGILWFAEKHPSPWMRWVWMTPEIASYLLENHNTTNRPLSEKQVNHYKAIIASGQWHMTHQGAAMDTEAALQDGQHRMQAIADLGEDQPNLKLPMPFFVGMPPENFKAIDEGLLRTAAQLFVRGSEKNGSTLQTCLRMVIAYQDQNPRGRVRLRMTNEQILTAFEENPDALREAAGFGMSYGRKAHTSSGAMAAAHYLLRRANGWDNTFVDAFFEGLASGRKAGTRLQLDDDDPRAVYRETLQSIRLKGKRATGMDQLAMIILSWNNVVANYSPRYLKFSDNAPIPRIVVCQDAGDSASACPRALLGEVDGAEGDE